MDTWNPRWYYVMQNKTSGMLYAGQTAQIDFKSYKGSGGYWVPHCRKHGGYTRSNIEVIEQAWFEDKTDAELWLKMLEEDCSEYWNSDVWANQIPENTLDNPLFNKNFQRSVAAKALTQASRTKANATMLKNQSGVFNDEVRSAARINALVSQKENKTGFYNPKQQSEMLNVKKINGLFSSEKQRNKSLKSVVKQKEKASCFFDKVNQLKLASIGGKAASNIKFKCLECELVTSAAPLGTHQRYSGHSGRIKVERNGH